MHVCVHVHVHYQGWRCYAAGCAACMHGLHSHSHSAGRTWVQATGAKGSACRIQATSHPLISAMSMPHRMHPTLKLTADEYPG